MKINNINFDRIEIHKDKDIDFDIKLYINKKEEIIRKEIIHGNTETILEIIHFKNNLKHGEHLTYNEKEILIKKENYKNGKLNGESIFYKEETGQMFQKINFINNKQNGIEIIYNLKFDNEVPKEIKSWKNNKLNGHYYKYFNNGNLKIKANYKNNNLIGEYLEYYENGKLLKERNFDKNYENGKDYYENGNLKTIFSSELINGVRTISQKNYKNGDYENILKRKELMKYKKNLLEKKKELKLIQENNQINDCSLDEDINFGF